MYVHVIASTISRLDDIYPLNEQSVTQLANSARSFFDEYLSYFEGRIAIGERRETLERHLRGEDMRKIIEERILYMD